MYQKILVAVDESPLAQVILDQAITLAKPFQANLMLLHVLSMDEKGYPELPAMPSLHYYPGLSDLPLDTYRHQWESYEQRGIDRLRQFAEQARQAGVLADITQKAGAAGHLICELGRSWGADLICMGSRGRAGLSELLLGSVSNFVMHHAPCSVMIIRTTQEPPEGAVSHQHWDEAAMDEICAIPRGKRERAVSHLSGWQ